MPTITIAKDANATADNLQVTVTQPGITTVFQNSVANLKTRLAAYDAQLLDLQNKKMADQQLLVQIVAEFDRQAIVLP